jgi:hypothetical protein
MIREYSRLRLGHYIKKTEAPLVCKVPFEKYGAQGGHTQTYHYITNT